MANSFRISAHTRRWPLARKRNRVHVSSHVRGWPRVGSSIKTSKRSTTTIRRTKVPSGRTLWSSTGEPNPIPLAEEKKRFKSQESTSSFHPSDYSSTELRSIAKGNVPEAYRHTMKRSDVPMTVRKKAASEMRKRELTIHDGPFKTKEEAIQRAREFKELGFKSNISRSSIREQGKVREVGYNADGY